MIFHVCNLPKQMFTLYYMHVFAVCKCKSKLIGEIRTRQMRFLGHVIRKDGLENLALTGKIEGKRGRGRKRMLWMTSLNAWIAERV